MGQQHPSLVIIASTEAYMAKDIYYRILSTTYMCLLTTVCKGKRRGVKLHSQQGSDIPDVGV